MKARFFRTPTELRSWFFAHVGSATELWVGFFKKDSGRTGLTCSEAVGEALCFGWIDTTVRRIDDERYANRFVPRRPDSSWTEANLALAGRLARGGRMHPAGRRAYRAGRQRAAHQRA
jgi:uncharacterized protein YdeI (YjbR/CyaY-like superfamily)